MKRLGVRALAAALVAGSAVAQPLPYAYDSKVFAAVDAVSVQGYVVLVTGIVQGEQTPSTWAASNGAFTDATEWAAMCQRSALIAMNKPGQYLLEIKSSGVYTTAVCKLSRVTP